MLAGATATAHLRPALFCDEALSGWYLANGERETSAAISSAADPIHGRSIRAETIAERWQIKLLMTMEIQADGRERHARVDQCSECPAHSFGYVSCQRRPLERKENNIVVGNSCLSGRSDSVFSTLESAGWGLRCRLTNDLSRKPRVSTSTALRPRRGGRSQRPPLSVYTDNGGKVAVFATPPIFKSHHF